MHKHLLYMSIFILLCSIFPTHASASDTLHSTSNPVNGFIKKEEFSTAPDSLSAPKHENLARLAYHRGDYTEALRHYQHIFITYPTSKTYYNIALCYSKIGEIGKAILYYERALLLNPTLKQARHNLHLLYPQTKDGLSDGRAWLWLDNLCYSISSQVLTWLCILLFTIMALLYITFRLAKAIRIRELSFYILLPFSFVWLLCLAMLLHQSYYNYLSQSRAIVIQKQALMPNSAIGSNHIQILHEGSPVFFIGAAEGGWQEVSLSDGKRGWLPQESLISVQPTKTSGLIE